MESAPLLPQWLQFLSGQSFGGGVMAAAGFELPQLSQSHQ
jgi:hypothetical protein